MERMKAKAVEAIAKIATVKDGNIYFPQVEEEVVSPQLAIPRGAPREEVNPRAISFVDDEAEEPNEES